MCKFIKSHPYIQTDRQTDVYIKKLRTIDKYPLNWKQKTDRQTDKASCSIFHFVPPIESILSVHISMNFLKSTLITDSSHHLVNLPDTTPTHRQKHNSHVQQIRFPELSSTVARITKTLVQLIIWFRQDTKQEKTTIISKLNFNASEERWENKWTNVQCCAKVPHHVLNRWSRVLLNIYFRRGWLTHWSEGFVFVWMERQ